LYYQAEFSHVFEKYWNVLDDPQSHPDSSESNFTKAAMTQYTSALSQMNLSSFEPLVDAEAKQSNVDIAIDAAISRLSIIQDACDFWNGRSSQDTGSGGPAPV
jgi:hypothetical protein